MGSRKESKINLYPSELSLFFSLFLELAMSSIFEKEKVFLSSFNKVLYIV